MASFALIPIISGMRFDLTRGMLGFDPLTGHEGFRTVWFTGNAWGNLTIGEETRLTVISGEMKLERLELPYLDDVKSVTIDGNRRISRFRTALSASVGRLSRKR